MTETDIELGANLFIHRKSQVRLLTKITTTVSFPESQVYAECSSSLQRAIESSRLWLPRTRAFLLSIHLVIADDIDLSSLLSRDVDSVLTDLFENAEMWVQLGYEATQLRCHKAEHNRAGRALDMEFEIRNRQDLDDQLWCPVGVASGLLQFVRIHFHVNGKGSTDEGPPQLDSNTRESEDRRSCRERPLSRNKVAVSMSNFVEDEPPGLWHRTHPVACAQPNARIYGERRTTTQLTLDEDVLCALVDTGVRSAICSRPIRLAPGVKCLAGHDSCRLSDLAPAMFVPNYVERLQEQFQFIPGISKVLSNFLSHTQPGDPQTIVEDPSGTGPSRDNTKKDSMIDIQRNLWKTVKNPQSCGNARRLQPLKRSGTSRENIMLDIPGTLQLRGFGEIGTVKLEDVELVSSQSSIDRAGGEEPLLHFCQDLDDHADLSLEDVFPVATEGTDYGYRLTKDSLPDVEIDKSGGQVVGQRSHCYSFKVAVGDPPQHQSRKPSRSPSEVSDVSMLLGHERPIKDDHTTIRPLAIGGPRWLTQNVIRMHPLRQQKQSIEEVDQHSSARERASLSLYERPDHGWWSDTSNASDPPFEDRQSHHLSHLENGTILSSFLPLSGEDNIHHCLTTRYDSGEEEDILNRSTPPMSKGQKREGPDGSLEEVIGKDHLLWHMWQRRASVAPRGEQDVTDMKTLFATDPDMKLFSSRWDLSPSDISSGSNEDPMLHDTTCHSPFQSKPTPTSPVSPNSGGSYFTPTRTSSSSGYVGRSSADPSRKSSLIKRFTWGGRHTSTHTQPLDVSKLELRTVEVKKRRTLNDYETMEKDASNDDSSDMLF